MNPNQTIVKSPCCRRISEIVIIGGCLHRWRCPCGALFKAKEARPATPASSPSQSSPARNADYRPIVRSGCPVGDVAGQINALLMVVDLLTHRQADIVQNLAAFPPTRQISDRQKAVIVEVYTRMFPADRDAVQPSNSG